MKIIWALILVLSTSVPGATHASDLIDATLPLFSQKLGFKVSKGWKPGSQQSNANVFLLELIPPNEEISSWTELLAISAYRGMSSKLSAKAAYEIEADSVVRNCPSEAVNSIVQLPNPQGYDAVSAIIGCTKHPKIKGRNEVAFYTFIEGKSDIYMVKKAFREPLAKHNSPRLNEKSYLALAPEVMAVRVCKNDSQGPSCIAENR